MALESDSKFEEKLTCGLENDKEFGKFSSENTKVLKWGLLQGHFIQSRKRMTLKCTGELCVMTVKNDPNFEKELTSQFKSDTRNLTHFVPSTRKSHKFAL